MSIEYKERDLAGGWSIELVWQGISVGRIRRYGSGFAYFRGMSNELTPRVEREDISSLKQALAATPTTLV